MAREQWIEDRRAELLPVEYFHVVFTLPQEIASLTFYNKELLYGMLFHATAQTLLEIATERLGIELGFFCVLLTRGNAVLVYLSWIRLALLLRLWSLGSESPLPSPSPLRRSRRRSLTRP
jgi:hypothetical protein